MEECVSVVNMVLHGRHHSVSSCEKTDTLSANEAHLQGTDVR